MKHIIILFTLTLMSFNNGCTQNRTDHTYPLTDGPDKNPLKGWNSGWWDNFDEATVGFQYLKWKEFEPTNNNFQFSAVEDVINRPGSAGKHIILRLYTDWFGNNQQSDAGPSWLYNDFGVARLQYNGKYITDYNNENYIQQVTEAIQALANQYKNDPRIYAIQLGVLGYWGEWHTYSYDDPNFDIEEETGLEIIDAYKNSFPNKQLMGRYPWRDPLSTTGAIGFHNDYFKPNDGHSDEFDEAIADGNKYLEGPVGGEIPPIDDWESNAFMAALYETPQGMSMIETGHYSTMKVGSDERPCQDNPNGSKCQGFMELHRKMGYNYQITSALFSEMIEVTDNLEVTLTLTNIGVAPMYYNWEVQFALLNQNDQAVYAFDVDYDITQMLPSNANAYTVDLNTGLTNIAPENYKLGLRIIQPEADADKDNSWQLNARNTYIEFANDIPTVQGQWNSNNALQGGWSILGNINIIDSTLGVNSVSLKDKITIYPNPASQFLNITADNSLELEAIKIFDNGGLLVKDITVTAASDTQNINISALSDGNYLLIIFTNLGVTSELLIKQ